MSDLGEGRPHSDGIMVISLERALALDPYRLAPHSHEFFQVFHLTRSSKLMHDFRSHRISGESMFFVRPGQVHAVVPEAGVEGSIISFTREFFDHQACGSTGLLLEFPLFYATDGIPWIHVPAAAANSLATILRQMHEEFDAPRPGVNEMLRALLAILLIQSSRFHRDSGRKDRTSVRVRAFYLLVENHFHEWQAVTPFAREMGITTNHLNDLIRDATGMPAGEHLRRRRLLDAKRLLLHSDLTVAEIAYRVGFKDPSYFSRFFSRYERQSPHSFRVEIREKYRWNDESHREC